MAGRWTYIFLVLFAIHVIGTFAGSGGGSHHRDSSEECDDDDDRRGHHGHHRHHDDDDDDDDDHHKHGWHWGSHAGRGVLIAIIIIICGLLALVSWLTCTIYRKCRARKVSNLKEKAGPTSTPPKWASNLVFQPEMSVGFGLISDGLTRVGPAHLIRKKQGTRETDGATWAVAMTKGKHVFEITWPWAHRGSHASVGVGTSEAPIKGKGTHPLVGSNNHTWGLDIVARRTRHSNRPVMTCPTDGSFVPDKFLMYVNVDEGLLGFGNEVTYWGDVITDLPKQGKKPLYVMIGTSRWQAEVSVQYLGSAPDGDNDMVKQHPPHHIPPLSTTLRAPPTYTEVEENEGPIMVKPAVPEGNAELDEKPCTPPPPYMHHLPVGYNPTNGGDSAGLV